MYKTYRHGSHSTDLILCPYKVYVLSSRLTQYQAWQAEKQIKAEFERLRNALAREETLRLEALATEEELKIAAVQELIDNTKRYIVSLNEITDSLKKEMGNEDLPLLRVRESTSFPILYLVLSMVSNCMKPISISLFYVLEFPEFKNKVSNHKIHYPN